MEALLALPVVKKVLDVIRWIADGDEIQWKPVILTVASWVAGVGLAALIANSGLAADLGFAAPNFADLVIAGITIGSGAGVIADATNVTIK